MSKLAQTWLYSPGVAPNSVAKYRVINLYHDFGGKRLATFDFNEIPNSQGKSSVMMQGIHKIPFLVEDRPAYIEIKKTSMSSFGYKCVVDNAIVPEAHCRYRSSERQPFTASISSTVFAPGDDEASVAWYTINVCRQKDDMKTVVLRRFSEFLELEKKIHEIFRGREDLPCLPKRASKALVDHSNDTFLEERKQKNAAFLDSILTDPSLSEIPMVAAFLGFLPDTNIREMSIVFTAPSIDSIVTYTPAAGMVNGMPVSAVVHVIHEPEQCPYLEVGDAVVKVSGSFVTGMSFPDVITKIKRAKRPLVIQFWQILPEPRLSLRERDSDIAAAVRNSSGRVSNSGSSSTMSQPVPAPTRPPPPVSDAPGTPPPPGPLAPPPPLGGPPPMAAPDTEDANEASALDGPSIPFQPQLPQSPAVIEDDDAPEPSYPTPQKTPPAIPIRGMGRRASAPCYEPPPVPLLFTSGLPTTLEEYQSDNDDDDNEDDEGPHHAPPPRIPFQSYDNATANQDTPPIPPLDTLSVDTPPQPPSVPANPFEDD